MNQGKLRTAGHCGRRSLFQQRPIVVGQIHGRTGRDFGEKELGVEQGRLSFNPFLCSSLLERQLDNSAFVGNGLPKK
jgi:hypothetical protein